jgi:hypothetical protein
VNKSGHLGRVDFVHLSAHKYKGGSYFLVVVLVQVETQFDKFPHIGDGEVERALGDVKLFTEPENPLGCTAPISFLDGLDRRR